MLFMTHDHSRPTTHVLADGLRHPVVPLIRREDIHRLASLGVLRHITSEGTAPLGYGPWQLAEDAHGPHYRREPAGTAEEISAAMADEALSARRAQWVEQARHRRIREANKMLLIPATDENIDNKIAALQIINEA